MHMNLAPRGVSPYSLEITDVCFYLYAPDDTHKRPVAIRVNIEDSNAVVVVLGRRTFCVSKTLAYPVIQLILC